MGLPKGSKQPRDSKAAYAASQPLYTALRAAVTRIDDQKADLTLARNLVQTIHVKLAAEDTTGDEDHARYINAVVRAWKSSSETFLDIFTELAKVTAADASEGKDAKYGHRRFVALRKMARSALEGAKGTPVFDEGREKESALADEVEMKDVGGEEEESDLDVSMSGSAKRSKPDGSNEGERPKKLPRLNGRHNSNGVNANESRKQQAVAGNGPPAPATLPTPQGVEFEDVSAEVEARLAAKKADRKAKKLEKKRKRLSEQSFDANNTVGSSEKPNKKAKGGHDHVPMQANVAAGNKRVHQVDGAGGGKKRNKTKV